MRRASAKFRGIYGASPLHALLGTSSLAIVAIAVRGWFDEPTVSLKYILFWFVGAILAHDMLLLPLYSAVDRLATIRATRPAPPGEPPPRRSPGWVFVRVPLLLSGLLLLVFGPEILQLGNSDSTFHVASGQHQHVYMARYLMIVAVLFALAALLYTLRALRGRRA
ncbi:MAG: hypothetical protein H0X28_02260 [Solirubrobacterales bacterium]|nr:hypothetical protein [Solirubrobacterales bacterium]